jgi:hypothetical protein
VTQEVKIQNIYYQNVQYVNDINKCKTCRDNNNLMGREQREPARRDLSPINVLHDLLYGR